MFIQVTTGQATDREGLRRQFDRWNEEAEARQGETKEMPADVGALFTELMSAIAVDEYLDLKDPWIV